MVIKSLQQTINDWSCNLQEWTELVCGSNYVIGYLILLMFVFSKILEIDIKGIQLNCFYYLCMYIYNVTIKENHIYVALSMNRRHAIASIHEELQHVSLQEFFAINQNYKQHQAFAWKIKEFIIEQLHKKACLSFKFLLRICMQKCY